MQSSNCAFSILGVIERQTWKIISGRNSWIPSDSKHYTTIVSHFLVTFSPAFDAGGTFDKSGHIDDLYAWLLGHKNRPFPSSLVPLFQNDSTCETFHMKMISACSFILMQIKAIFIRMVLHLDSLWNRGTRELRNGLLVSQKFVSPFLSF